MNTTPRVSTGLIRILAATLLIYAVIGTIAISDAGAQTCTTYEATDPSPEFVSPGDADFILLTLVDGTIERWDGPITAGDTYTAAGPIASYQKCFGGTPVTEPTTPPWPTIELNCDPTAQVTVPSVPGARYLVDGVEITGTVTLPGGTFIVIEVDGVPLETVFEVFAPGQTAGECAPPTPTPIPEDQCCTTVVTPGPAPTPTPIVEAPTPEGPTPATPATPLTPTPDGPTPGTPMLPETGSNTVWLALVGVTVLIAGALVLWAGR